MTLTRRERLEARLARRQEWAASREAKANASFSAARKLSAQIPFGQPILVGHHSERHARRDAEKITNGMLKGVEHSNMAEHHESRAHGIANQLETSIFSDDENAIQALEAKIAGMEAERAKMTLTNKLYRKGDAEGLKALGIDLERLRTSLAAKGAYWGKAPHLPYEMQNLGGNITRCRKRIEDIKRRNARTEAAEQAGGVSIEDHGEYVRVTFAEKPEREIIDALKAAGFWWGGGSWSGKRAALPAALTLAEGAK